MLALTSFFFHEDHAGRVVERLRWPDGVRCPHCGTGSRIGRLGGSSGAQGSFKCYECRKRFTVRTASVLEGSHLPLANWLRLMLVVHFARRPVGCKHVEEAAAVSPRIARALRHKWAAPTGSGAREEPGETPLILDDYALLHEDPEARSFADLCKVLDVAPDVGSQDFARVIGRLIDRPPPTRAGAGRAQMPPRPTERVPLVVMPMALRDGRKVTFDRA